MKKIFLAAALALGLLQATTLDTQAQVSVNINIVNQPAWGPVGYDYVQYYYIPEINAYYDVMSGQYIFLQNRRWIHARVLPPRYRNFDLYRTHKVVINRHNPYNYNNQHRRDYGRYRNDRSQIALRDHRGGPQRPAMHQNNGPSRPQQGYTTQNNRPAAQHQNRNRGGNQNMQRTAQQNRPMAQHNNSNNRSNSNMQRPSPQRERIQQGSRDNRSMHRAPQQNNRNSGNAGPRR